MPVIIEFSVRIFLFVAVVIFMCKTWVEADLEKFTILSTLKASGEYLNHYSKNKFKSLRVTKKLKYMENIYGNGSREKFEATENSCFMVTALSIILLPIYIFHNSFLIFAVLGLNFIVFAQDFYKQKSEADKAVREAKAQLSEMLMRIILAMEAGMIFANAWEEVAFSEDGRLFTEMRAVLIRRKNGKSLSASFQDFAFQYHLDVTKEISDIVLQNIENGGNELVIQFKRIYKENFENIRRNQETEHEVAMQKMLLPSLLIFLGIMILVIVPLLSSFS